MARMYEMNLIIRLQDRASARMRRISGDMSALSRHAQAQNKLQNLRNASAKQELDIKKKFNTLNDLDNKNSEIGLSNTAKRATAEARFIKAKETALLRTNDLERQQWASMSATGREQLGLTTKQRHALLSLDAAQARLNANVIAESTARKAVQADIAKEIKLLNARNAQIAVMAPLEARGNASAKSYGRGRALAHGGSLAFMGGAVTTGLGALAAGSYAKFDVQAAKAATQLGSTNFSPGRLGVTAAVKQTQQLTKELEQQLIRMGKKYPATIEEMASASYNIFSSMSLGATAAERLTNGMKVLTEANQAAVGGQVDLSTATDTLITVFNDFDPRLGNLSKNMAELFSIVRFMRGGFEELGAGMNKLAPAAKQAQQSLVDTGAAFAVVTQAIPSAAQSSTALARLMDLFGNKEFIDGMERAGESVTFIDAKTGAERLLPLYDILQKIVNLDPTLQLGGPKLTQFVKQITQFGSATGKGGSKGLIQMQRALTILITQHQKHNAILNQAKQDVVEYDKSVEALSQTADVKWKTAMNNLKIAWIEFGKAAMPVLLKLLKAFQGILTWFDRLGGRTKTVLGTLIISAGLAAAGIGLLASAMGGIMMITATKQLWKIEKALQAIAIANGEVAATSTGAKGGIIGMGKSALKAAGWIGVLLLAFDTLKNEMQVFGGGNVKGNFGQKLLRGWVTQFKTASTFLASFVGQGKQTGEIYDSLFNEFPTLFGKSVKKAENEIKGLTDAQKEAAIEKSKGESKLDKIIKINDAAIESEKKLATWQKNLAKATTNAKQSALKQQQSDIESAAKNLLSKYQELESANKTAIGGILGGPISGGPILGAFQQINQTLMGVGVAPIKVPVEFLMQDAEKQLENFNLWRGGLKKLSKKLPKEMLNELQAAGIEKLPEILSLADSGPEFLKAYVKVWKDTKAARDAATQADFKSTLDLYMDFGKDVAWRIITGMVGSGAEAALLDSYSKLITTTFATQLTASMNAAVAQAVQDYKETNPKPAVKSGASKADMDWAETYVVKRNEQDYAKSYPTSIAANALGARWKAIGESYAGNGPGSNRQYPVRAAIPRISFRASGGLIPGSGTGDTVPAMLTPGEVVLNKRQIGNASRLLGTANHPQAVFNKVQAYGLGGVVKGDLFTPGEYVVSKPMISDLTKRSQGTGTTNHVTHETNLNIDVTNPTEKAILDALKPVLFGLRHQP